MLSAKYCGIIWVRSKNCEKRLNSSSCLSVRLSVRKKGRSSH